MPMVFGPLSSPKYYNMHLRFHSLLLQNDGFALLLVSLPTGLNFMFMVQLFLVLVTVALVVSVLLSLLLVHIQYINFLLPTPTLFLSKLVPSVSYASTFPPLCPSPILCLFYAPFLCFPTLSFVVISMLVLVISLVILWSILVVALSSLGWKNVSSLF